MKVIQRELSGVFIWEQHYQYGKFKFIDKNDAVIQVMDVDNLPRVSTDFYECTVIYEELLPYSNPYKDEIVATIKFVDYDLADLKKIKEGVIRP